MLQDDGRITDFDAATAVRRTEGGGLVADLDPGWDVGNGILNGGYLLATVARAAVLEGPHPHPVALSASYLRATRGGRVTLTHTPGSAGRTVAHAHVVLADEGGPCLTVQATTATLGSGEVTWACPPPEIAPVEECLSVVDRVPGRVDLPDFGIRHRVDTRLDPATAGWLVGRPSGEPVMRAWVRFAGGRDPDPFALAVFADSLPPSIWSTGRMGWTPTVQLQVLLRALPAPGWCLVEARAGEVAGDWLDEDYRIWDSTGRLVAQSRQLARAPR